METLDEVISTMEYEATYNSGEQRSYDTDALHYLKEYQEKQKTLKIREAEYKRGFEQLGVEWSRLKDNPPLTWDELKTMEGKPVWFEVTDPKALPALDSGWGIVGCTSFTTWEGVESFSLVKVGVTYAVPIAQYGRAWNVYRKERE